MSNGLNPKTFDLIGAISGRDYPTLDVEVYIDEATGFAINKANEALRTLEILGKEDEMKEVQEQLDSLVEKSASSKIVLTLKGIPERVRRSILSKVEEDFPSTSNMLGIPEPNPQADEAYTLAMWEAYIQKFTAPDGSENPVTKGEIQAIYDELPDTVHKQISDSIEKLRKDHVAGFEYASKEVGFLSQASPEG